jgi:hypothetical protein
MITTGMRKGAYSVAWAHLTGKLIDKNQPF